MKFYMAVKTFCIGPGKVVGDSIPAEVHAPRDRGLLSPGVSSIYHLLHFNGQFHVEPSIVARLFTNSSESHIFVRIAATISLEAISGAQIL